MLEWASQGGQFLVLRAGSSGRYEEIGRGRYNHARAVWMALMVAFENEHRCEDPDDAAIEGRRDEVQERQERAG
ncbi:hypothetical protein FXF51_46445 [Nonomuraea sp. PA05]|uniref:hypothetical protein n=1 Tax=Nonomuraea sp. PA05 TaxID=2604466 RepID=UPI0011D63CD5|nr:hypothetical protein [Nonomuraea sp. PA05]TYB55105.1 hypothetical protein FXF51_46445 [Nonomuraea sp. PA05]